MYLTSAPTTAKSQSPKGFIGDKPLQSKKSMIGLTFRRTPPVLERVPLVLQNKCFLCPSSEVITVVATLSKEGNSGHSKPNMVRNDSALWLLLDIQWRLGFREIRTCLHFGGNESIGKTPGLKIITVCVACQSPSLTTCFVF